MHSFVKVNKHEMLYFSYCIEGGMLYWAGNVSIRADFNFHFWGEITVYFLLVMVGSSDVNKVDTIDILCEYFI